MNKVAFMAGPYISNPEENIKQSLYWANIAMNRGYTPIIPHFYMHYLNKEYPRTEAIWREASLDILRKCDILARIPGQSEGADNECKLALELGIPIIYLKEDEDAKLV